MIGRLRPRRLFWRPTETFGFGPRTPDRLDLVESEFQIGWRVLIVCRVDLLTELDNASAAAAVARDSIDRGLTAIDVELAKRLGQPTTGISRSNGQDRENEK